MKRQLTIITDNTGFRDYIFVSASHEGRDVFAGFACKANALEIMRCMYCAGYTSVYCSFNNFDTFDEGDLAVLDGLDVCVIDRTVADTDCTGDTDNILMHMMVGCGHDD